MVRVLQRTVSNEESEHFYKVTLELAGLPPVGPATRPTTA
jgi:hypothetical protein